MMARAMDERDAFAAIVRGVGRTRRRELGDLVDVDTAWRADRVRWVAEFERGTVTGEIVGGRVIEKGSAPDGVAKTSRKEEAREIRTWAKAVGLQISPHGPLSPEIVDAYRLAEGVAA